MVDTTSYYDIIKMPVITEKSTALGKYGKYIFKILPHANKSLIRKAIEEIFSVKVTKINILNQKGKMKKFKGFWGHRSDTKKAIITLKKDQVIDIAGGYIK